MFRRRITAQILFSGLTILLLFCGCFSIPFIGKKGPSGSLQNAEREFARENVFIGYDGDGRKIVELRLVKQQVSKDGLVVTSRLFPTENFKVRNIFRGLRSINYYPIERRFHRLELKAGRRKIKTKVKVNLEVKDQKPLDALFEHSGEFRLLPDTIDMIDLKFQDVKRWGRMSPDSLSEWYADKENYLEELDRRQRRSDLVESYRRRLRRDYTQTYNQYDSLYVTTNNTYVYLEKDVSSEILFVMNSGERIDYGVSDGLWVEIPLEDTVYSPMLEIRRQRNLTRWRAQRQAARSGRRTTAAPAAGAGTSETEIDTTLKNTAYVLDVMVQPSYRQAVAWEMETMQRPADVRLFAQILQDREKERQARLDSIVQARVDSLARIQARADSILKAQQIADSLKAAAADSLTAAADTSGARNKPPAASRAQAAANAAPADGTQPGQPSGVTGPDSAAAKARPAARTDSLRRASADSIPKSPPAAVPAKKDSASAPQAADSTASRPPGSP